MLEKDIAKYEYIGDFDYTSGNVDITDPCYSRDVWCRINGQHMRPGEYHGYAKMSDEGEWGIRVAELLVLHKDYDLTHVDDADGTVEIGKEIGEIGVDAGLAGVFQDKPDFEGAEWSDFCNLVMDGQYWVTDWGFCTSSGYGDGGYPVYEVVDKNGYIVGYNIVYIDDKC